MCILFRIGKVLGYENVMTASSVIFLAHMELAMMQKLLNVPPLGLIIQAEAFATADTLAMNGLLTVF